MARVRDSIPSFNTGVPADPQKSVGWYEVFGTKYVFISSVLTVRFCSRTDTFTGPAYGAFMATNVHVVKSRVPLIKSRSPSL